ncbi:MAG: sensor histidine kinase [Chloroflexi bacterium]|nr:sensor histidine kinase [Chloroflexota bacterium]
MGFVGVVRGVSRLAELSTLTTLRRFPLFYKLLIANSLLVGAGSLVGTWLGGLFPLRAPDGGIHIALVAWLAGVGPAVSILVNYLILKGALQPVSALRRLAAELEAGSMNARANSPFFTDPDIERLVSTVNRTLDQLQRYQAHVRRLSQRGTEALEAERMRISRELHDETSQVLTALLIMERMLLKALSGTEHQQAVERMLSVTRQLLKDVQRICVGLRPPALDDLGLPGALRSYVEGFMPRDTLRVHIEVDESIGRFSSEVELAVYRIAQEALTNVVRHAHATEAWLSLAREGDRLVLSVRDNGVGFALVPPGGIPPQQHHLGLFGMTERAALVGGQVAVESAPGQGTTVRAIIPIGAVAAA